MIARGAFLVHPCHELNAATRKITDARERTEAADCPGVDVSQVPLEPRRRSRFASQGPLGVAEKLLVRLYLSQETEPLAAVFRQAVLQGVAEDTRGLRA